MKTRCSRCKETLDNAVHLKDDNAISCDACGQVSRIELLKGGKYSSSHGVGDRKEVPLPNGISMERSKGTLIIKRRWFSRGHLALLLFTLLWDGAVALWYTSLFGAGSPGAGVYSLSPILHIITGVILSWYTLAMLFNTTSMIVSSQKAIVKSGPFRWFGNLSMEAKDISQLWSQKIVKTPSEPLYNVLGKTSAGRVFTWIYGLENPAQALYIEQEIEKFLNIADVKMEGEFKG